MATSFGPPCRGVRPEQDASIRRLLRVHLVDGEFRASAMAHIAALAKLGGGLDRGVGNGGSSAVAARAGSRCRPHDSNRPLRIADLVQTRLQR
jgi:hypothetical protein